MKQEPRNLIIGLGQIGFHNAEYLTRRGLFVDGFDIQKTAVQRALGAKVIRKEATKFEGYDTYLICVSTHNPQNASQPNFDSLLETAIRLGREGKEGALVAIESTVTKGICNRVFNILQHRLHVAHVPHRFYSEEKTEHGVRQLRVLGGCKPCCATEAADFYREILDVPILRVRSVELAELSKVVENTYRFLEIAFAEELKMVCDDQGLNFEELRAAVNSKWNVEILEARQGIGGHCLPKDTQTYYDISKRITPFGIVPSAIRSNKQYEKYVKQKPQFRVTIPEEQIALNQA
jgi:UDP-N-acetyl-D-mannosaminuronic acid dehydrogenase